MYFYVPGRTYYVDRTDQIHRITIPSYTFVRHPPNIALWQNNMMLPAQFAAVHFCPYEGWLNSPNRERGTWRLLNHCSTYSVREGRCVPCSILFWLIFSPLLLLIFFSYLLFFSISLFFIFFTVILFLF
jgi:hypothetical protein